MKKKYQHINFLKLFALFFIPCSLFFVSCKPNSEKKDNGLQEIRLDEKTRNSDIIRTPVSSENTDTSNQAKIQFVEKIYDFGTVKKGEQIKHVFKFRNIGKSPLLISDVRTTCGCTVPTWNKSPISQNTDDELIINFNTEGKFDKQIKYITVVANTIPSETILTLTGMVVRESSK